VLRALGQLDDDVPRQVWVPKLPLKTKSSPIVCKQGNKRVELVCGEVKRRLHFLHVTEPQGNVSGRRGRLITPATEAWGWTKEIFSSACECDKECKQAGLQTLGT